VHRRLQQPALLLHLHACVQQAGPDKCTSEG
jgi:hypothetical protein